MRRAAACLTALLLAALVTAGCSPSGAAGPAYHLAALRRLLVTRADVDLPGWTVTTPAGEEQSHTATAITYFARPGFTDSGLHSADATAQLSVILVATAGTAAARTTASTALSTATASLRSITTSGAVAIGTHGRQLAGRTKGDGALQTSVFFVEGRVAVTVTLSSSTSDQPSGVVAAVAKAQDVRLRAS